MENRDTTEMKLVSQIFDFAKSLAEMELTDVALSLFSAYILEFRTKIVCHVDYGCNGDLNTVCLEFFIF